MSASTRIQLRRGTAAEWSAANPVLADGEPGFIEDTGELKIGDGVTAWNSLNTIFVGGTNRISFTPFKQYRAGDQIVQGGTTVTAISDFVSGASYVGTDWQDLAISLPAKANVSSIGAASGIAPLNASTQIDTTYLKNVVQEMRFTWADGNVTVANGRWSPAISTAITLKTIRSTVDTAPTGASLIIDLQASGSGTVFTLTSHRPAITAGSTVSSLVVPDTVSFAAGTQFRVAVTQIGSTVPGANLAVSVGYVL